MIFLQVFGPFALTFELDNANASLLATMSPLHEGGMNITQGDQYEMTLLAFNSTGAESEEVAFTPHTITALGLCKEPEHVRFCLHHDDPDDLCHGEVEPTSLILTWISPKLCAAFLEGAQFDIQISQTQSFDTPLFRNLTFF